MAHDFSLITPALEKKSLADFAGKKNPTSSHPSTLGLFDANTSLNKTLSDLKTLSSWRSCRPSFAQGKCWLGRARQCYHALRLLRPFLRKPTVSWSMTALARKCCCLGLRCRQQGDLRWAPRQYHQRTKLRRCNRSRFTHLVTKKRSATSLFAINPMVLFWGGPASGKWGWGNFRMLCHFKLFSSCPPHSKTPFDSSSLAPPRSFFGAR